MMNTLKLSLLGMGMMLLPVLSMAAPTNNATDISKDVWLEQVRTTTAKPICKSFMDDESISEQMKVHHVSYEQCAALIPVIADKCEKKYSANLPLTINDQDAEKWGKLIGECIGNDFVTNYLSADVKEMPKK